MGWRNARLIQDALRPTASFVDVWTSIQAFDFFLKVNPDSAPGYFFLGGAPFGPRFVSIMLNLVLVLMCFLAVRELTQPAGRTGYFGALMVALMAA